MATEYLIKVVGEGSSATVETSTNQTSGLNENKQVVPNTQNGISVKNLKLAGGAMILGKGAVNFATSNVAEFTGSKRKQERVNSALKMMGHASHIAISPATGIPALALDIATTQISKNREIMWKEKELEEKRARLNYSSFNRSRNGG